MDTQNNAQNRIRNYTLEKHLEAICEKDHDYDVLLAAWRLNKENLKLALNTITSSFPHFSQHDSSHSSKVLDNIQRLLGKDRIEQLGATDTFLLLMAAMTHDLGMYLYYGMLQEKWSEEKMADILKDYANSDDKTIAQAARLLSDFKRCPNDPDPAKEYKWALEIKNAVTIIIAHQMRSGHEERSAEYIKQSEGLIADLTHGFYFDLLPSRYLTLLSKVAYLHGTDFKEVMTELRQKADGFKNDFIHPRFIACMIRMGDLLDIDSNRFNDFALSMVKEVPESSKAHHEKHQAVKHLLISPTGIEAELDCKTDASYRVARQVFDWLESEVEHLSRNWSRIAPSDLSGLPPVLHTDSIKILYKGLRTREELMNLRFDISSKKTFEMLKGGAIYENPGRVFMREIVQNAMDATKLQIWEDIYSNPLLIRQSQKPEIKFREDIRFSDDMPISIYDGYPINLTVEYDENNQSIIVTCEDCGTGISDESLIRMTSQVGASRKADENYEKTIKEMPYFLQPTAAFGLGLQTVFYVTDEFVVETRCTDQKARRIKFRTSTNGSYCSVEDENIEFQRPIEGTDKKKDVSHGTTVRIVIDKEHLDKLFELDEKGYKELISNPEAIAYHIPQMIDRFARKTFRQIGDIPFLYHSPYNSFEATRSKNEYVFLKEEGDFRLYERIQETENYGKRKKDYSFLIEERKYGSRLKIAFYRNSGNVLLRNIPVTDDFGGWWENYTGIDWDLCCREADKLVNLSRDDLLPQGYNWCEETMDELLPTCVKMIHKRLLEHYQKCKKGEKKDVLEQYASLCLLNWQLPQPIKIDITPLSNHSINYDKDPLVIDNQGEAIKTQQLIESDKLVLVSGLYSYFKNSVTKNSDCFRDDEIIVNRVRIPDAYVCYELFFVKDKDDDDVQCYRLIKKKPNDPQLVTISDDDIRKNNITLRPYGFNKYQEIVVSKEAPSLGFDLPYHVNCWIYPVSRTYFFEEIQESLPKTRTEAESYLREKDRMEKLVPDYIVKLIQKYNVLKNDKLTKEEIYDAYIRLILDHKFGFEKKKKAPKAD